MKTQDTIALVGAGAGGKAILETLVQIPDINISCVYDISHQAPGIKLAQKAGIPCYHDTEFEHLKNNEAIHLIFEVTGDIAVYQKILKIKSKTTQVVGSTGSAIIFHLLDAQNKANEELEQYKNSLEQRIIEKTKDLEKTNCELTKKIREGEELNEKLQQINDEKTKYLLKATHQLKAPFASIQSYTDVVLEGYTGAITEKTHSVMQKIKARCELLSSSIKDMLYLANLKSCVTENLVMEPVNIRYILLLVVEQCRAVADKLRIKINCLPCDDQCRVVCSQEQMIILFSILLNNAINYSCPDTEITITTETTKSRQVIVKISDQGIGIPRENIPLIFNEYFRSNNAVEKDTNGSGLGLSIAKEIINIHGFDITVESEIGKGSEFAVRMKLFSALS
ncbi:MAG: hypothetical protein HQM16_12535 [Deltaproteobacteria bacterium]|nr:hypothetical protein [Deltaproteobacteria bacterium]